MSDIEYAWDVGMRCSECGDLNSSEYSTPTLCKKCGGSWLVKVAMQYSAKPSAADNAFTRLFRETGVWKKLPPLD